MSEPAPLSGQLARLAEKAAHRVTAEALEPDDYDLAAFAARGVEEARAFTWERSIPSRFSRAALEDFTEGVAARLSEWAALPTRNLLMLGPVGVGKTHAAVAACRPVHHRLGLDVRFMPVIELLDLLRPGGPEGALYSLADVDLLILDDLGSEKPSEWTSERLYAVINRRWLEERPTVATTNLEPAALEAALGERTYSRLVGSGAVVERLSGSDRRRRPRG